MLTEILSYGFVMIVFFFSTPFILWDIYKDNLVNSINKSDAIGLSVCAFLPFVNHIIYLLYLIEKDVKVDNFKYNKRKLNKTSTCWNCNITSRYYQLKNGGSSCPHCGGNMRSSYTNNEFDEYPFAPKLTTFGFIKLQRQQNKVDGIKEKLHSTERYDRELESYEQLQLKKLKELEAKANEIKAELAKSGANQQ